MPLCQLNYFGIDFLTSFSLQISLIWLSNISKSLEKGLPDLKTCKNELTVKLARAETISSSDEHWLDNEANTVDEEHVLDTLESALDYERGLERLGEDGKAIVKKLREWASDLAKVAGNKWKCTYFFPEKSKLLTTCVKVPHTKAILKHLRRNWISQLLPLLHGRKMLHWLSASKSSIGIMETAKTNRIRLGILIQSTQTLK